MLSTGIVPSIFTRQAGTGEQLALNALAPLDAAAMVVPVDLVIGQSGAQVIAFAEHVNFGAGQQIWLRDLTLGVDVDLTTTPGYGFTAQAGALNGRFVLHFGPLNSVLGLTAEAAATALTVWPNPTAAGKAVQVQVPLLQAGERAVLTVRTVLGQQVSRQAVTGGQPATVATEQLSKGVYVLTVESAQGRFSHRLVVE